MVILGGVFLYSHHCEDAVFRCAKDICNIFTR